MKLLGYDINYDNPGSPEIEPATYGDVHLIIGRKNISQDQRETILNGFADVLEKINFHDDAYHIRHELIPQARQEFVPQPGEESTPSAN